MKECLACGAENLDYRTSCGMCGRPLDGQQVETNTIAQDQPEERKTAMSTIGILISLICGIVALVTAVIVGTLLPSEFLYMSSSNSSSIAGAAVSGIITIIFSLYALRQREFVAALLGSLSALLAAWVSFGILALPIALVGLILVVLSRQELVSSWMQQTQLPPIKKINTPIIAAVAIMTAVVVVVILVLLTVFPTMIPYPIHKGDYLVYSYTGTAASQSYSGTMKMEFTDVTSTTFTVTVTYAGDLSQPSTSETYPIEDIVGIGNTWTLGAYQGVDSVSTTYGMKNLDHYQWIKSTGTWDYWIGHTNKIPYTMTYELSGGGLQFHLFETNIDWIKNG